MFNEYDGVHYFGEDDSSYLWEFDKINEKLVNFNSSQNPLNINEAIELFNIACLIDKCALLGKWTNETIKRFVDYKGLLKAKSAEFFSKITSESFVSIEDQVCALYQENFWDLFAKFDTFKKIDNSVFKDFLLQKKYALEEILCHEKIVTYFSQEITEVLEGYERTAEFIVRRFLEKNPNCKIIFPRAFTSDKFERIFEKYVVYDGANHNTLFFLSISKSSKECPISPEIRLAAKEKREKILMRHTSSGETPIIAVSFASIPDYIQCEERGLSTLITHNIDWLTCNLDYPTILNNFRFIFEFFDDCWRINGVSIISELNVFERPCFFIERMYPIGVAFQFRYKKTCMEMDLYYSLLQTKEIYIEKIISWFYTEYIKNEFGIDGFHISVPDYRSDLVSKSRSFAPEIDGILKQFKLLAKNGSINYKLLENSAEFVDFKGIPSLIQKKYAYAKSEDLNREIYLMFSDQSHLSYLHDRDLGEKSLFELLKKNDVMLNDFDQIQQEGIRWLLNRQTIFVDEKGKLSCSPLRCQILKEFNDKEVVCPFHRPGYNPLLDEMEKNGEIEFQSTLFSRPEAKYLNFILNDKEFDNGRKLRNRYAHTGYPLDKNDQWKDYMLLIKVLIEITGKIYDDIALKDQISGSAV
ncbi:hypothetical protein [Fibrobacter sp. UWB7]|uniref:hypothetical protein n=1 Tax=Fibrobacter sp. UWB7 TaxID=1896206 RepID=UPI0009176788|nr:hypothetical protein [Fibrobacter sp. UWB7]SHM93685.1 hypothetical protein SAMN05720467_2794 [Fibrobacter sp. UWB7]